MINGDRARFSHPGAILPNSLLTLNRGAFSWLPRPVVVVKERPTNENAALICFLHLIILVAVTPTAVNKLIKLKLTLGKDGNIGDKYNQVGDKYCNCLENTVIFGSKVDKGGATLQLS